MLIVCKAAATFNHPKDKTIEYKVRPSDLLCIKEAPEWIADTMMYRWMLADGTIEVSGKTASIKELEVDPVQGAHADGKKVDDEPVFEGTEEPVEKPKRGRRPKEV